MSEKKRSTRSGSTRGAKGKLTKELIAQVGASLAAHNSHKTTYELVGIAAETFYRWMREGEAARSGLRREFYETVKQSQARSKTILLNSISKDPSWQAKAWILERLHHKEFGKRETISHTGADGESEMPTGGNGTTSVAVTMRMDPHDNPFVDEGDTDPEPESHGTDPWPEEKHTFEGGDQTGRTVPDPPEPPPAPPGPTAARGPSFPARETPPPDQASPPATPPDPRDSQGRPRDPDERY